MTRTSTTRRCTLFLVLCAIVAGPDAAEAPPQLPTIEPVATWGCDQCTGPELFGEVMAVAATADGTVFVLDAYEPVVRRFSATGDAVAFGNKGQGPGEFVGAGALAVTADQTLEVIDTRLRRMMRLDFDGNELSTRPLTDFPTASDYARDRQAWYLAILDFRTFTTDIKQLADGVEAPAVLRALEWPLDEEGEPADVYIMAARPGGGFAIGDGNLEYRIRLYDATGEPAADIHRDVERVAKTDEELAVEQERRDAGAARRARMVAAEGGSTTDLGQPPLDPLKRYFYAQALRYDDAGRLWVLTGRGGIDRSVFDLFGVDNQYLGEVKLPAHVSRYDLAGDRLVTAGLGEVDQPVVRLWRVGSDR